MKIVVAGISGNVGKSTLSAHMFVPRMKNAKLLIVESINQDTKDLVDTSEKIRGEDFKKIYMELVLNENIVVSILYLFANDYTNEQVAEYLVSIGYAQSMVQEYIRQLSSQSILELLPCILCPNCTDCEFSDLCCLFSP